MWWTMVSIDDKSTPHVMQICKIKDGKTNIGFFILRCCRHTLPYIIQRIMEVYIISVTLNERLHEIQERSITSFEYTLVFVNDGAMLYFRKRNTKMYSFFSKPDLRYPMLNPQLVRLAYILQNASVWVFGLPI